MFSYANGKKLLTLGYAATALLLVANNGIAIFSRVILGGYSRFTAGLLNLLGLAGFIVSCAIVLGFGMIWMANRALPNLIAVGALGLSLVFNHIAPLFMPLPTGLISVISGLSAGLVFIILAMKVKTVNNTLFLLLCAAFVFKVLSALLLVLGVKTIMLSVLSLITIAGHLICAVLGFAACRTTWLEDQ